MRSQQARANGGTLRADITAARDHALWLASLGMTIVAIADEAGVSQGCIGRLIYGHRGRPLSYITTYTERLVLAARFNLDRLNDGATIPIAGTRRRLQGLVAAGYSVAELARRLSWARTNLRHLVVADSSRNGGQVWARTARLVRALTDELINLPAPAVTPEQKAGRRKALRMAAKYGFVPLLAWDDDKIDDPAARPSAATVSAKPDLEVVHRALLGQLHAADLNRAEKLAVTAQLLERGHGVTALTKLLNCNGSTARGLINASLSEEERDHVATC